LKINEAAKTTATRDSKKCQGRDLVKKSLSRLSDHDNVYNSSRKLKDPPGIRRKYRHSGHLQTGAISDERKVTRASHPGPVARHVAAA